jgi:eukaryotic-like serine/threonine-protein kinase
VSRAAAGTEAAAEPDGDVPDTQPGLPLGYDADTDRVVLAEADLAVVILEDPPRVPGNYRLLEPIAAGGMGVVYRARHLHLDRLVAIKLAHEHLLDGEVLERFSREATATAAIAHAGIAAVHDFGYTPRGRPYLVLEYLEGESLAARLQTDGRLEPEEAGAIAAEVADVMAAAHRAGVVHRDLSPANIFLASDGDGVRIKVLDFGIAKLTADDDHRTTLDDRLLGTPHYMAPEQSLNPTLADHRSDIYALGCVLFEMLTGAPPFVGGLTEVLEAQRRRAPDAAALDGTAPALRELVLAMLAKSPAERPASMAAVAAILTTIAANEPPAELAGELTSRVWRPRRRWRSRQRLRLGLAAAVVLATATLLFLMVSGLLV